MKNVQTMRGVPQGEPSTCLEGGATRSPGATLKVRFAILQRGRIEERIWHRLRKGEFLRVHGLARSCFSAGVIDEAEQDQSITSMQSKLIRPFLLFDSPPRLRS